MAIGINPQTQGVPEVLFREFAGSHALQPVDRIEMGALERPLDEKTIQELSDSIEHHGLISPIGVREFTDENGKKGRLLVYGAHRFEAWRRKFFTAVQQKDQDGMARWHTVPCMLYPEEMTENTAHLLRLSENLHRKELTAEQRKEQAMIYGKLLSNAEKGSNAKKASNADRGKSPTWFSEWYKGSKVSETTARGWWKEFAEFANAPSSAKDANKEQQDQFFDWHLAKVAADKAAKAAKEKKSQDNAAADALDKAIKAYNAAIGVFRRACDVAKKAGVPDVIEI
jgi:ParB-like chromosome segregation protein Spo0J